MFCKVEDQVVHIFTKAPRQDKVYTFIVTTGKKVAQCSWQLMFDQRQGLDTSSEKLKLKKKFMLWLSRIIDILMGNKLKLDVDEPGSETYFCAKESHLKTDEKILKH